MERSSQKTVALILSIIREGAAALEPVIKADFPDPCLILTDGIWYAFATGNGTHQHPNVQMASSPDFVNWTLHGNYDPLPIRGSWAGLRGAWAPDVNQRPDGTFVMYYSSPSQHSPQEHCIGAATSLTISGPYTPIDTTIACDLLTGGAIDPNLFHDPVANTSYLIYKQDGNSIGSGGACQNSNIRNQEPTALVLQLLNPNDLITPIGEPQFIMQLNGHDGPNIEAPALFLANGAYYLTYNAGCFADTSYQVRYVACTGVTDASRCQWWLLNKGTAWPSEEETLLRTGIAGLYAPGGLDAVVGVNSTRVVFHADINTTWFEHRGEGGRIRAMYATELGFQPNKMLKVVSGAAEKNLQRLWDRTAACLSTALLLVMACQIGVF